MKHSIVAMFGQIIPAPLQIAPMLTGVSPTRKRTATCLGTVSVVIMARAASSALSRLSFCASFGIAASILSIGSCTPMRPVEHTRASVTSTPVACAASSAMRTAAAIPCSPVAALAFPELTMTVRAEPSATCCSVT